MSRPLTVADALKLAGGSFIKARRHYIAFWGELEWYQSWPTMSEYWENFARERHE